MTSPASLTLDPSTFPAPVTTLTVADWWSGLGAATAGLAAAGYTPRWAYDDGRATWRTHYATRFGITPDPGPIEDAYREALPVDLAWVNLPLASGSASKAAWGPPARKVNDAVGWIAGAVADASGLPPVIVAHLPTGIVTHRNAHALLSAWIGPLQQRGYTFDMVQMNAAWFVPQSRPRLALIAARQPYFQPEAGFPATPLRPRPIVAFMDAHPDVPFCPLVTVPAPIPDPTVGPPVRLVDVLDHRPAFMHQAGVRMLQGATNASVERAELAASLGEPVYLTAYRRGRNGMAVWELRSDGLAGCLRRQVGGSSRQHVLRYLPHDGWAARPMTTLEYAYLMGVTDMGTLGMAVRPMWNPTLVDALVSGPVEPVVTWLGQALAPLVTSIKQDLANQQGKFTYGRPAPKVQRYPKKEGWGGWKPRPTKLTH